MSEPTAKARPVLEPEPARQEQRARRQQPPGVPECLRQVRQNERELQLPVESLESVPDHAAMSAPV